MAHSNDDWRSLTSRLAWKPRPLNEMLKLTRHHPLVTVVLLLAAIGCSSDMPTPAMMAAIHDIDSEATIVERGDVDEDECDSNYLNDSPGLVVADFNGDGYEDFSALVRVGDEGEVVEWQGRTLRHATFVFAIMEAGSSGGFSARYLQRFESYLPLSAHLGTARPGMVVRNRDTGEEVELPHPAVELVFCEKSAALYYLDDHEIRSVFVGD